MENEENEEDIHNPFVNDLLLKPMKKMVEVTKFKQTLQIKLNAAMGEEER